jgi:CAAX prenyl protease-like protein
MSEAPELKSSPSALADAVPYVAPYVVFAAFTWAADKLPGEWRSAVYLAKVLVVGGLLWVFRRAYTELRVRWGPGVLGAVVVGVGVIVVWIGLDPYYPQAAGEWQAWRNGAFPRFEHLEKMAGAFNPFAAGGVLPGTLAAVVRILGAVVVVPVFEELFWRSWLMRFLIRDDFRSVPPGSFTWTSFAVTAGVFGVTHHEWLAGIICGVAFGWLMVWRRDLFTCVVAHAVANAALAAYVLATGAWQFW